MLIVLTCIYVHACRSTRIRIKYIIWSTYSINTKCWEIIIFCFWLLNNHETTEPTRHLSSPHIYLSSTVWYFPMRSFMPKLVPHKPQLLFAIFQKLINIQVAWEKTSYCLLMFVEHFALSCEQRSKPLWLLHMGTLYPLSGIPLNNWVVYSPMYSK